MSDQRLFYKFYSNKITKNADDTENNNGIKFIENKNGMSSNILNKEFILKYMTVGEKTLLRGITSSHFPITDKFELRIPTEALITTLPNTINDNFPYEVGKIEGSDSTNANIELKFYYYISNIDSVNDLVSNTPTYNSLEITSLIKNKESSGVDKNFEKTGDVEINVKKLIYPEAAEIGFTTRENIFKANKYDGVLKKEDKGIVFYLNDSNKEINEIDTGYNLLGFIDCAENRKCEFNEFTNDANTVNIKFSEVDNLFSFSAYEINEIDNI